MRRPKDESNSMAATDRGNVGRLDNKQIDDTIVTMERVREAISVKVDSADESTWLWLASKQIGLPLKYRGRGGHEERAKDSDSS